MSFNVRFVSYLVNEESTGNDRAFVCADAEGNETMWVLTGAIHLIAVNPLTQETVSAEIGAGRAVRIEMYGDREEGSLIFASEEISVNALPEEAIRHIASDKALQDQLAAEEIFDAAALASRIRKLPMEKENAGNAA